MTLNLPRLIAAWRLCCAGLAVGVLFAAAPVSPAAAAAESSDGFREIFDGKTLEGWDGDPTIWRVEDGCITGQTSADAPIKNNTFCIWRAGNLVDDFVLKIEFKIEGGNSGVQYRSRDLGEWKVGGYQADFDAVNKYSGSLYEERGRGMLAKRGSRVVIGADGKKQETKLADEAELAKVVKTDGWNEYEITAAGNHITHKLNGETMIDLEDNQVEKRAMAGILALQAHAGPPMKVQFKNIRFKRTKLTDDRKKLVLVAGKPSHGPGEHEFNAGTIILQNCLNKLPNVVAAYYKLGWPKDPTAFDNADSVMLYMDGGKGHPLIAEDHLDVMSKLIDKGVGLCCVHYAVEIPKDKGGPELTQWIGGYYETGYSINPHWVAEFKNLPNHPVLNGVKPFSIRDEWYYNIRFPEGMSGVTPLLQSSPPDETRKTEAAKSFPGRVEVVAWTTERPGGGRGFGFTGGHTHINWGNDDFRKVVLNALLWTAKADVPADGAPSSVTSDELSQNLDPKPPKKK